MIVDEFYDDLFSYISYFSDPFSCDVRGTRNIYAACGYTCYFLSTNIIAATKSFAIAHCAPLVTITIGVVFFKQLKYTTNFQDALISVAVTSFVSAIAMIVLSGG